MGVGKNLFGLGMLSCGRLGMGERGVWVVELGWKRRCDGISQARGDGWIIWAFCVIFLGSVRGV